MNQIKTKHRSDENLFRHELAYQLVFVFILASLFLASSGHAELKSLNEAELKSSTAQAGFTEFTMSASTARLFLDIHIETHATINSLSSGWYNNGSGVGWDLNGTTLPWAEPLMNWAIRLTNL